MKKKKLKSFQIYFMFKNYSVDSYHSGEAYGDWWKENQTDVGSTYSQEETTENRESIKIDFNPKENIYLVYGLYNTGDSFGHSNGEAEVLEVFETEKKANKFAEKVKAFYDLESGDPYGLKPKEKEERIEKLKNILGNSLQESKSGWRKYDFIHKSKVMSFPWGGYFENLTSVEVVELRKE